MTNNKVKIFGIVAIATLVFSSITVIAVSNHLQEDEELISPLFNFRTATAIDKTVVIETDFLNKDELSLAVELQGQDLNEMAQDPQGQQAPVTSDPPTLCEVVSCLEWPSCQWECWETITWPDTCQGQYTCSVWFCELTWYGPTCDNTCGYTLCDYTCAWTLCDFTCGLTNCIDTCYGDTCDICWE